MTNIIAKNNMLITFKALRLKIIVNIDIIMLMIHKAKRHKTLVISDQLIVVVDLYYLD